MNTYKLGQEVKFKEEFKIETMINKTKLQIKTGDKAIITNDGFRVLNGEARGKVFNFNQGEVIKGYDYENISKRIFDRIEAVFGLELLFEDEGIEADAVKEEIENVLINIL